MILTIGPGGSGLTFLNWSIIFLRGDITYTNLEKSLKQMVDINPLRGATSHNFYKDHIQSSSNLCQISKGTKKSVIYVTPTDQKDFDYILQFNCKKIIFDCQDQNKELFTRMATQIPGTKILNLIDKLTDVFGSNTARQTLLECSKMFTHYYKIPTADDQHFIISYNDIFKTLDQKIIELFLFLDKDIDQSRLHKWKSIYKTYQEKNCNLLSEFAPEKIDITNSVKLQVFKEILQWKNSSYCLK